MESDWRPPVQRVGICIWSAENGKPLLEIAESGQTVNVAFRPDGKMLVGVDEAAHPRIWDAATGELIVRGHARTPVRQDVVGPALCSSSSLKSTRQPSDSLVLQDTQTGQTVGECRLGTGPYLVIGVSPRGTLVAEANAEYHVMIIDPRTRQTRAVLPGVARD